MKQLTFKTNNADTGIAIKQGYAVVLSHAKGFKFAAHKQPNPINSSKCWYITELSSGYAVKKGEWDGRLKDAIQQANERIKQYGIDKFKDLVAKCVPDTGPIN